MEVARSSSSDTEDESDSQSQAESTAQEEEEDMQEDGADHEEDERSDGHALGQGPALTGQEMMDDDEVDDDDDDEVDALVAGQQNEQQQQQEHPPNKKRRVRLLAPSEEAGGTSGGEGGSGSSSNVTDHCEAHPQRPPQGQKSSVGGDSAGEERTRKVSGSLAAAAAAAAAATAAVADLSGMERCIRHDSAEEPTSSATASSSSASGCVGASTSSSSPQAASSSSSRSEEDQRIIDSLQSRLHETNSQLVTLMKDLRDAVECPVCFNIPRSPPVPCCRNGHVICGRCKTKCEACPKCRSSKIDCVSQVAASIIQRINHPCEFRDEGCNYRGDIASISGHEENCKFRLVRCPHWACDEMITARNLTHHVIAAECGDSYRDKPLPYQEEMVYTQALDDEEGNGFWKPSLLEFNGITFYLQVEKCGKSRNWYFYIQMEGSPRDCEKYGTTIKVSKKLKSDRNAIVYNGGVCPIDIKGAAEVEASGVGLNIRDSAMEKIFDVDRQDGEDSGGAGASGSGGGQQQQQQQQQQHRGEEEKGFKFWVDVDIFKVDDK